MTPLPPDLRVVVLDVGNTLVELDHDVIAACARQAGLDVDADASRRAEALARRELDLHMATPGRSTEATGTFELYMRRLFHHLGGTRGWEPLLAKRSELWRSPVPGAIAVLDQLHALGFRLAVVSNSSGQIAALLDELGLATHLEVIVDSGVIGIEKPDPRIFAHALEPLGVSPDQAVYIGDLYHVDVRGAELAGLYPILLDPRGDRDDVQVTRIRRLEDLPALLRG